MTLPSLPDVEALKTARPASSGAALPLVQAPAYTLGLRALRTHTQHYTLEFWQQDVVPMVAETRRILYRPSPLAQRLWVGAWVGAQWFGVGSSPPAKTEVKLRVINDSALAPVSSIVSLNLGRRRFPGFTGDWSPAPPFVVGNSDLNQGSEQLASLPWDGLDITGLNGLDGWVEVVTEGVSVLSVMWVELVEEVQP